MMTARRNAVRLHSFRVAKPRQDEAVESSYSSAAHLHILINPSASRPDGYLVATRESLFARRDDGKENACLTEHYRLCPPRQRITKY